MDGMEQSHVSEDETDEAVRAFETLREEVAAQRRALEQMAAMIAAQRQQPDQVAPDYSPTLGTIAQELRAVGARLDGIEAHPALRLTPVAYATQMTMGVRQVEGEAGRSLTHAQGRFSDALYELRSLIGSANSHLVQQRREWISVAVGVALGLLLWFPVVWLTPFGGGHWLAARMIGDDRWVAGETLMQEANAEAWARMVRLYQACPRTSATEVCEAAMVAPTVPAAPVPAPIAPAQPPARKAGR
jgi:hypothetical protein